MDKTKIFIKMSEKAVEIQKDYAKNPRIGDNVYKSGYVFPSIIIDLDEYYDDETWRVKLDSDFVYEDTSDLIWLPTQDKLQEIWISGHTYAVNAIIENFYKWWLIDKGVFRINNKTGEQVVLTSMEQLWLAFVMKENYNKTWNGKDWVLI